MPFLSPFQLVVLVLGMKYKSLKKWGDWLTDDNQYKIGCDTPIPLQVVLALGRMNYRPSEEWGDWLAQELHSRVSHTTPPAHVVQLMHAVACCAPTSAPLEDWVLSVTDEMLLPHIQVRLVHV